MCGFKEIPLNVSQFIESIFFNSMHFFPSSKSILRHFNRFFIYFALILAYLFCFYLFPSPSFAHLFSNIFYPSKMIYELCHVRPFHLLWLWSTVSNNVSFDGISFVLVCGTVPAVVLHLKYAISGAQHPGEKFDLFKYFKKGKKISMEHLANQKKNS